MGVPPTRSDILHAVDHVCVLGGEGVGRWGVRGCSFVNLRHARDITCHTDTQKRTPTHAHTHTHAPNTHSEDVAIAYGFNKLLPGEVPQTLTVCVRVCAYVCVRVYKLLPGEVPQTLTFCVHVYGCVYVCREFGCMRGVRAAGSW